MPIAMFIYAWSSFPFVPWVALTIGITLYIGATFIIYLAAFNYLADWWVRLSTDCHNYSSPRFSFSYGPFASSAIAGQSLASAFYFYFIFQHKYSFWVLKKKGIWLRLPFLCLQHRCTMLWLSSGLIPSLAVSQLSWCQYLLYVFLFFYFLVIFVIPIN